MHKDLDVTDGGTILPNIEVQTIKPTTGEFTRMATETLPKKWQAKVHADFHYVQKKESKTLQSSKQSRGSKAHSMTFEGNANVDVGRESRLSNLNQAKLEEEQSPGPAERLLSSFNLNDRGEGKEGPGERLETQKLPEHDDTLPAYGAQKPVGMAARGPIRRSLRTMTQTRGQYLRDCYLKVQRAQLHQTLEQDLHRLHIWDEVSDPTKMSPQAANPDAKFKNRFKGRMITSTPKDLLGYFMGARQIHQHFKSVDVDFERDFNISAA